MFGFNVPEISVVELHRLQRESPGDVLLLDIRTEHERAFASIGGVHIDMHELASRLAELEAHREKTVVVYCRSGNRSASVVAFLRARGFERAANLAGGILAWSREIDASVPRY